LRARSISAAKIEPLAPVTASVSLAFLFTRVIIYPKPGGWPNLYGPTEKFFASRCEVTGTVPFWGVTATDPTHSIGSVAVCVATIPRSSLSKTGGERTGTPICLGGRATSPHLMLPNPRVLLCTIPIASRCTLPFDEQVGRNEANLGRPGLVPHSILIESAIFWHSGHFNRQGLPI